MCNARPEDWVFTQIQKKKKEEHEQMFTGQKTAMGWSSRKNGEIACSSKYRTFKVSNSFLRGQSRKTWKQVIRSDLKEAKVSEELA